MKPLNIFHRFFGWLFNLPSLRYENMKWNGAYAYKASCRTCDWAINVETPIYSENDFIELACQHHFKEDHSVSFDNRKTPGKRLMPTVRPLPCRKCGRFRDYGDVLLEVHCRVCSDIKGDQDNEKDKSEET